MLLYMANGGCEEVRDLGMGKLSLIIMVGPFNHKGPIRWRWEGQSARDVMIGARGRSDEPRSAEVFGSWERLGNRFTCRASRRTQPCGPTLDF